MSRGVVVTTTATGVRLLGLGSPWASGSAGRWTANGGLVGTANGTGDGTADWTWPRYGDEVIRALRRLPRTLGLLGFR